jgi:hypothetical protein
VTLTRRTLLGSLFCAAAAPAIVRISSLMPVRALPTLNELLAAAPPGSTIWLDPYGGGWITFDSAFVTYNWPGVLTPTPITPTPV